jgi:sugar lactone lactonase YvrE
MAGAGYKIIGEICTLGEGPLWHPLRQRLFWFDIPAGKLISTNAEGGQHREWLFGEPASAAGWVDKDTLLVATASGLQKFDIKLGSWETLVSLEKDNPVTRSNDGRTAPDGSFWIGTMGRNLEHNAGAYYRYHKGRLERIVSPVSIPNSTCFSPDGKIAYLADTARRLIWRWQLGESGAPIGAKEVHIDLRQSKAIPDGSVVDSEGYLWNAQWGGWRIVRYDPNGREDRVISLPVQQPTCPAFGGPDLTRLYITSAREGLSDEQLAKQPDAGRTIAIDLEIAGLPEYQAQL